MRDNEIAARIYLTLGEHPPEDAPDEWFAPRTETVNPVSMSDVEKFSASLHTLLDQLESYSSDLDSEEYQTLFYDAAKSAFGENKKEIRNFFRFLYAMLFGTTSGPRWGQFLTAIGKDEFVQLVRERSTL